jgi:hypothetical protein
MHVKGVNILQPAWPQLLSSCCSWELELSRTAPSRSGKGCIVMILEVEPWWRVMMMSLLLI